MGQKIYIRKEIKNEFKIYHGLDNRLNLEYFFWDLYPDLDSLGLQMESKP